jgi:hypothetical protein
LKAIVPDMHHDPKVTSMTKFSHEGNREIARDVRNLIAHVSCIKQNEVVTVVKEHIESCIQYISSSLLRALSWSYVYSRT